MYETGVSIRRGKIICETSFAVPTKDAMPSVDHESIESGEDGEVEGDEEDKHKEDTEDVSTDAYYDNGLPTSEDSDWDKPVWRHLRKRDSRFGTRDLRKVAKSAKHLATHKPALPNHCEVCAKAKTKQKYRFAKRSLRKPKRWGENLTLDIIYMRDWYQRPGVGGYPDVITIVDVFSKIKFCEPISSLDTLDVINQIPYLLRDGAHTKWSR